MEARVIAHISIDADTDIQVRSAPSGSGATWIEFGSAAVFANEDQLRRLSAVITDHLSPKGPVLKVADMTTAELLGHVG